MSLKLETLIIAWINQCGCFFIFLKYFIFKLCLGVFGLKFGLKTFEPHYRRQGLSDSFLVMFCCWVNVWGCFYHNLEIFIFRLYFWAKIWSRTSGHIWEDLDCLISFFSYRLDKSLVMLFYYFGFLIFLFLGHFWSQHRDQPFSTYAKFSEELTFLTSWYAHVHVHIRG